MNSKLLRFHCAHPTIHTTLEVITQYSCDFQDFLGQKLDLYIGDPKFLSSDGKHHTLKFKMPKKTRKVHIQSNPPIAPSTVSTTFTLICELETKNDVITVGDQTFEIVSKDKLDILKIPFHEGIRHPFFDKDNLREKRWKKYNMTAALMGTPATINVNGNVTSNVTGNGSVNNSGGGGMSFGPTNDCLVVNAQNTGTMMNSMTQSANKETDKEAKKEGEGQTLQENATSDPNYKENCHRFK